MCELTPEVLEEESKNGIALQLRGDGKGKFEIVYSVTGPHGHERLVPVTPDPILGELNAAKTYDRELRLFRQSTLH